MAKSPPAGDTASLALLPARPGLRNPRDVRHRLQILADFALSAGDIRDPDLQPGTAIERGLLQRACTLADRDRDAQGRERILRSHLGQVDGKAWCRLADVIEAMLTPPRPA